MPVSGLRGFLDDFMQWLRQIPVSRKPFIAHHLASEFLDRKVIVDVYHTNKSKNQPIFFFLDGQDLRTMPIRAMQQQLSDEGYSSFTVVGIHANEARMWEYGTISRADYGDRGNRAPETAHFILEELIPFLQKRYFVSQAPSQNHVGGFSLGALVAFDMAWHYPQQFGTAGIFSGALWWRSRPFNKKLPDANRILHNQVAEASSLPPVRYWFQAGTKDEDGDRNQNGIIDAIDDTLQLMDLLRQQGQPESDLHYLEIPDGRHEPATWAVAMPDFFRWALRNGAEGF
ncbi:alpha/beta hydrolase [Lewinella cohaerens]|uniref:alpha/beta hydrolase n=1 Tax=Lewinella cohaerens TaxID=70995 RepID=UPI000370BDAD|nr:alpha/beta hydrolase-fold protein [Lewinella cohaerens]